MAVAFLPATAESARMLSHDFDIGIIGGGFSGTMLAVHLLRQSKELSIAVVEPRHLPGRGLAYSSPHRFHLLNVPAGEMSAFPDLPDDFLRWARTNIDPDMQERSFPTRSTSLFAACAPGIRSPSRFRWSDRR